MSLLALVLVFVLVSIPNSETRSHKLYYDIDHARSLFEHYIRDYGKKYKDAADKELHFESFVRHLEIINESNKLSTRSVFRIGEFTDYTLEQVKAMLGVNPPQNNRVTTTR